MYIYFFQIPGKRLLFTAIHGSRTSPRTLSTADYSRNTIAPPTVLGSGRQRPGGYRTRERETGQTGRQTQSTAGVLAKAQSREADFERTKTEQREIDVIIIRTEFKVEDL